MLCVGTGRTVLLCAAVSCNALKWVSSKFRYIIIYDNRYVNRNRCVYKDKCTWDVGECMKLAANFNYLYEQNKDISTGAVADREKGNTTVDRAICVCIRCSIVFCQVEIAGRWHQRCAW